MHGKQHQCVQTLLGFERDADEARVNEAWHIGLVLGGGASSSSATDRTPFSDPAGRFGDVTQNETQTWGGDTGRSCLHLWGAGEKTRHAAVRAPKESVGMWEKWRDSVQDFPVDRLLFSGSGTPVTVEEDKKNMRTPSHATARPRNTEGGRKGLGAAGETRASPQTTVTRL